MQVKQISSLEKVMGKFDFAEIKKMQVLCGEKFSYQIGVKADKFGSLEVEMDSQLADYVKLFKVVSVPADAPYSEESVDDDFLIKEPAIVPDVLIPLEECDNRLNVNGSKPEALWVDVQLPEDMAAGNYKIALKFTHHITYPEAKTDVYEKEMTVEVVPQRLPEQRLLYARWLHTDCIAVAHQVEIHSEEHWKLIEDYIKAAAEVGVNMILVPVHTPPLDTAVGVKRPCVQLVEIEKQGDRYYFGFEKFKRFIEICKRCGIKYYEIAHMFSQGNSKFAPNIVVTENGKKDWLFGWHVKADDPEYVAFVKQYVAAIAAEVEREGISEQTFFHISDEPSIKTMEAYCKAGELIRPYIGKCRTFDALSNYEFYEQGLVEIPVTLISELEPFLSHKLKEQWIYYAFVPQKDYINALLAMPLYRVRMLGVLLYKYDIKGFLHWGLNFYHTTSSYYPINPYLITSAESYASGDPFILYPAPDGVYHSMRGKVTMEAMEDMRLCQLLEDKIGREAVVQLIDEEAGMDIYFNRFPKGADFFTRLRKIMISMLQN